MLTLRRQNLFALMTLAAAFGCSPTEPETAAEPAVLEATAAGHDSMVEGMVTDAAGQPVAGAYVKLRNAERRLTIMVVSQDDGRYAAKKLPAGNWTVQGVGGEFQSAWSNAVTVAQHAKSEQKIALTDQRAPALPAAWPRRMPEEAVSTASLPDGPGRTLIAERCTSCHVESRVVANRFDRDTWHTSIEEMREMIKDAGQPELSEADAKIVEDYLVANLPPMAAPDPNSRLPRTLAERAVRNYRVVQYDLENEGAETHDVAVDPWGVGWANQRLGGKVSRFDPESLEYSEISPPMTTAPKARPGNLQISAEGVMWLPDPNERRWLSYDIKAEQWTTWAFPTSVRGQPNGNSMAIHPDGSIWASGPGAARRLDPVTKEWKAWDAPTWLKTKMNPGGYGITVAGDGRVWFAENLVDRMARVDPATGKVDEFPIPVDGVSYPRRMDADAEGNVWVGLWQAGKLLKIDQRTAEMKVIDPPTPNNGAYAISFDLPKNLLWVTLHRVDTIASYNPATEAWVQYPLPQAETDVRRIEVDPTHPNRIWWSTTANNARLGFIELLEE